MRYAVVPSRGCYGSGSVVRPLTVRATFSAAKRQAECATAEYRRSMPGFTSGGYRVVETDAIDRGGVAWLGHELDRVPTAREA